MQEALEMALLARQHNEIPVGAVVVYQNKIIGRGRNCCIENNDPVAHAEIIALRDASNRLANYRLVDCDLYVTVEPCSMCAGAIVHSRINSLYYGTLEPKSGVVYSRDAFFEKEFLNHKVTVTGGLLKKDCKKLIQNFFKAKRGCQK